MFFASAMVVKSNLTFAVDPTCFKKQKLLLQRDINVIIITNV